MPPATGRLVPRCDRHQSACCECEDGGSGGNHADRARSVATGNGDSEGEVKCHEIRVSDLGQSLSEGVWDPWVVTRGWGMLRMCAGGNKGRDLVVTWPGAGGCTCDVTNVVMLQWLTRKCERERVAQGRAGAASAAFDGLNLRLDLIAARSCAVHVVRTPGLSKFNLPCLQGLSLSRFSAHT